MQELVSILIVTAIVIFGYLLSKLASRITFILTRDKSCSSLEKCNTQQIVVERFILIVTVVYALFYLGVTTAREFLLSFIEALPLVLLIILLFILGSVIISLIMWFLKKFIYYLRINDYVASEARQIIFPSLFFVIHFVFYLILAYIIFTIVEIRALQTMLNFIFYPTIILLLILAGIAIINPLRDFTAKLYLMSLIQFRPGSIINIDSETYTIKRIRNFYTELTNKESLLVIPNRVLAAKVIKFKKPMKEIDTLRALQQEYVTQLKSHCGPATVQMALSIFDHKIDQRQLSAEMKTLTRQSEAGVAGTHPVAMVDAVEKLTQKQVRAAWVDFDHIHNLQREVIIWLNQGALIIVDYKKKYLFPDAKYAHYSLVVGVRGDEFLVVDPSQESGGVYYSDYRDILIGMDTYSELIKGKRGYIVLAPVGTQAYERIKKGYVYSHSSMYDQLTKRLEVYLSRLSHSETLTETIPAPIRRLLKAQDPKEHVRRVWTPKR